MMRKFLFLLSSFLVLEAKSINIYKGWNLLGSSNEINLTKNFKNIKIIFTYNNKAKKWEYFTTDENLKSKLSNYKFIKVLKPNRAFWLYSDSNKTISYSVSEKIVGLFKNISLIKGWNLIGATNKINLSKNFNKDIIIIWGFDNKSKNWKFYSALENIKKIAKNYTFFEKTEENSGFWVYSDKNQTLLLKPNIKSTFITTITNKENKYNAFKIEYPIDVNGEIINASTLLTIPISNSKLKIICDEHGTLFDNDLAPTNQEKNNTNYYENANLISGDNNFIGIFPDYLGYGSSYKKVKHPYIISRYNAIDSLSAIYASLEYLRENNISFDNNLFITGYSEGGYNAMSLVKYITENNIPINLKAFAPMAGPYNVSKMADNVLNINYTMPYPAILGYIAFSYSNYYELNLTKILNLDHTNTNEINQLYTNLNSLMGISINQALLNISGLDLGIADHKSYDLFNKDFLIDYQNNNLNNEEVRILKNAFKENNVYNWVPTLPVNLIQCSDDDIIPYSMSEDAYNYFISHGAEDVTLTPLTSSVDLLHPSHHINCEAKAYKKAIEWFNSF